MTARRLGAVAALALVPIIAGCGASTSHRTPAASDIPLLPGAKIAAQSIACDHGSRAFCAVDLVVTDHDYASSDVLARDEAKVLSKHGWSQSHGDTGLQSAANSPGHKLRLTFATASGDLREIVLGTINRPWRITYALSNSMFDRAAAMSMMLETGST